MSRWLSRIDPRRKKRPQSEPQTYSVICRCGERSIGLRIARYQQVICKQCGEPLFVLPTNVYPAPPPPVATEPPISEVADAAGFDSEFEEASDSTDSQRTTSSTDEPGQLDEATTAATPRNGEPDLLSELANESKSLTRPAQREQERLRKKKEKAQARAKVKAETQAKKKVKEDNPLTVRVPLRQRMRRVFSPFRLIVVSALAVVIATGWWQVRSRNIENARLGFDVARKDAMSLLEEQRFVEAEPLLAEASSAADLIDRNDGTANYVRRLGLEVNVLNNLSQTSVYEAVESATSAADDDMESVLMAQLGDRWIVIDSYVIPRVRTDDGVEYRVEMPLFLNGVLVDAVVTTSEFDRLELPKSGGPVAFAAKIESCTVSTQFDEKHLTLTLKTDSVRLWANSITYESLGFADIELPNHLAQQAASLGVKQ